MQPTTPTPTRSAASVILDTLIIVSPISFLSPKNCIRHYVSYSGPWVSFFALRPAVFRSRLRYLKAFVMYEFFLLNLSIVILLFTYSKLSFLSIQVCIKFALISLV